MERTGGKTESFPSLHSVLGICLLICMVLIGTVSAGGSSGYKGGVSGNTGPTSGPSGSTTYSSSAIYTNWNWAGTDKGTGIYEVLIKNPSTCVYGITVVLPGKPSSAGLDYLAYAVNRYGEKLTDEQRKLSKDTRYAGTKVWRRYGDDTPHRMN
jgi:hypothetical protein